MPKKRLIHHVLLAVPSGRGKLICLIRSAVNKLFRLVVSQFEIYVTSQDPSEYAIDCDVPSLGSLSLNVTRKIDRWVALLII